MTTDASRKEFEKWAINSQMALNLERFMNGYKYAPTAVAYAAYVACDAAWRERLQSDEMVEAGAQALKAAQDAGKMWHEQTSAVITAILDEVENGTGKPSDL